MQEEKPHIDHNALSRQLAVYGHQTQGKLMAMRVFLHGLSGVGLQVAKNLILAGPKQVSIYDQEKITIEELGRNFYANQSHVGKATRAQASISELKDLNPNVTVNIVQKDDISFMYKIDLVSAQNYECVVVLDNYKKGYIIELNKACRAKNIGFIVAGNLGLYGYTFIDFGQNHRVFDATGQQGKSVHVAGITQEQEGLVCLHEEKKHGLNDGDVVIFRQVKGMVELNGMEAKIKVKSPTSFTIDDTRNFGVYLGGGIATEVKVPVFMKFHSFQKSLRYPYPPDSKEMPICNWQLFGVPEQLHVILNAIYIFYDTNKRLPRPLNKQDSNAVSALVKQFLGKKMEIEGQDFKVQSVDQKLIQNVCFYAVAQISPCSSFWGGIITQQIVKLTGKYSPLRQWLHHQFFEVLPDKQVPRTLGHSRYNDFHLLFGDDFVKRAASSRSFLVGAGALGCQFIKMFALMGVSVQGNGRIACTDDDNIEISNLNRQFLFRKHHVGSNKSQTACLVGRKINPNARFQSMKLRVSPDNEEVFNDQFWTTLDFVVNAVDNVKARQYIDNQIVWYEKPLFESGTLGTKCHSQIIIPHKTLSYNDIIDPPQQTIPLCTLKNFPYQIQHTIQWARDYFEGAFATPSAQLSKFYQHSNQFLDTLIKQYKQNPTVLRDKLQTLLKLYRINQSKKYQECLQLSVNIFQEVFYNQIASLINAFPQNHIIQDTGKPFWSGLKRAPIPIKLNLSDPIHLQFVQAAANIYAFMFNIEMNGNQKQVAELASKIKPIQFVPKKVKIEADDKQKKQPQPIEINQQDQKAIAGLLASLRQLNPDKKKSSCNVEFEKDDPTNFHIEFIGGISNLRARNYKIQQVDNFKVKLIAGKIIPAIATTTAMVVGAVGIQIIKFLSNKATYKNMTANLALPLWVFNDPLQPVVNQDKQFDPIMNGPIRVIPGKFTKWDKIDIKGPMTIQALKNHFQQTYKIQVSMITYGSSTVFSSFSGEAKTRLPMKVQAAIENVTKKQFPKWRRIICIGVSGNTLDGNDCLLPDVRYHL